DEDERGGEAAGAGRGVWRRGTLGRWGGRLFGGRRGSVARTRCEEQERQWQRAAPLFAALQPAQNPRILRRVKDAGMQVVGRRMAWSGSKHLIEVTIVVQLRAALGTRLQVRPYVRPLFWLEHIVEIGAEVILGLLAHHRWVPPPCSNAR